VHSFSIIFQQRLLVQITTLFNDLSKFITEDGMIAWQEMHIFIKTVSMLTNKEKRSILWAVKGKDIVTSFKN